MDNLIIGNAQIDAEEKRITINGDATRVIVFNPTDVVFSEKFYDLINELQTALKDLQIRAEEFSKEKGKDENGMPLNWREQMIMQREFCEHFRERIDDVFGVGTSQTAFGDTRSLGVFKQFLNGILPFFQQARAEKVAQYTTPASAKRNKRKG